MPIESKCDTSRIAAVKQLMPNLDLSLLFGGSQSGITSFTASYMFIWDQKCLKSRHELRTRISSHVLNVLWKGSLLAFFLPVKYTVYLSRKSEVMVVVEQLLGFLTAVPRWCVCSEVNISCLLDPVQSLGANRQAQHEAWTKSAFLQCRHDLVAGRSGKPLTAQQQSTVADFYIFVEVDKISFTCEITDLQTLRKSGRFTGVPI